MSAAQILDGNACASTIKTEIATRVGALARKPGLGTILVGDDPGSQAYVNGKHRDCAEVGISSIRIDLPATAKQSDLLAAIDELNTADECTGYIVQLPLPAHINTESILNAIDPDKDADGLHPINLGKLVLGQAAPRPCTPRAIVELLARNQITLDGKNVTIIGRGLTVGKPLAILLSSREVNATVTTVHTGTLDISRHTRNADVVVAALGKPHFLTADLVKAGVIAIDVGITRTSQGLVGDLHPDIESVASAITPMPGGIGPMTRAMLLSNLLDIAGR
jgi:methylenetetrahydrofolate dehydrogenase (NADP+)/methenyltetrahydrofolate cyclohydrolase